MPDEIPSRRHRHAKNSLYGLLSWLFPIFPTFVVTPILITNLGNEMYGLYVVILGFISYFFTGSIGRAAAKYIAEYRASGEIDKISDIVSSTILLTISLSLLATGLVVVFARFIVADIMLISPELQNDAVLALYIAAALILIGTTGQIFQLILQGLQRFDIYLLVTNLTSLLLSIGSIAAVLLGYSVLAILTSTLLVSLVSGIISFKLATRLLPEFTFTFLIQAEAWRSVWRYSASIIAYQLCGSLLLLFERG
ncbi:MAG: oligosaccharide flippase family protein, partial [Pyrinomonadaceae bacterium]